MLAKTMRPLRERRGSTEYCAITEASSRATPSCAAILWAASRLLSGSVPSHVGKATRHPFANAAVAHHERFAAVDLGVEPVVERLRPRPIDIAVLTRRCASFGVRKLRRLRKRFQSAG